MILHLIRHGQSTWNVSHIVQGQRLEPPLTDLGRVQAAAAAATLRETRLTAVLSSDQVRARETAEIVAALHALPVRQTPLLREQALGDLEGKHYDDLEPQSVPDGVHISEVRWGEGESLADVAERMRQFVGWLISQYRADAEIAVVSHGDSLRVLDTVLAGGGHRDVDFEAWPTWPNGHVERRTC